MQSPRSRGRGLLSPTPSATAQGDHTENLPLPAAACSNMRLNEGPESPRTRRGCAQPKVALESPAASLDRDQAPCQRCGTHATPTGMRAMLAGPKGLCDACGLLKDTVRSIQGTPDGKALRSPRSTPRKPVSPRVRRPLAEVAAVAAAPQGTPGGRSPRAAQPAASTAEARTPSRHVHGAGYNINCDLGPLREVTPEPSPRPAEAVARQQLQSPPRLFKSPRAPDAACSPVRTRSGMTPLKSPGAEAGGFHTPANRMRPTNRGPISPATSHDARQLMFLSAPKPHREPEQLHKVQTAPKSAPGKGHASISERNRAAAMARWHMATPAAAAAAECRGCGRDIKGAAAATGQELCGSCSGGSRKRKSLDGQEPAFETPSSPLTRSATQEDKAKARAALVDADADADFVPDGAAVPRPSKKSRRTAPPKKAAAASGPASTAKRPGRPPKWPERGEPAARDAAAAMLPGDFTTVEQILVEAPGRAPFRLTRLGGAPHGQPALALRQVQVALVPHTDRTSAFYLAMIRAAEAVHGLVRSASRPEMALLVSGGALAKGACRASIGTFPAVAKGLARLGVNDATIAALNAHDLGSHNMHKPPPQPGCSPATPADASKTQTGGDVAAGSAAAEVPGCSPPGTIRRAPRSARGGGPAGSGIAIPAMAAAAAHRSTDAFATTAAAGDAPSAAAGRVLHTPAAPASAVVSAASHRRRQRKPSKIATPAAVLAPMFASPEPRMPTSNGSADTALHIDPAWSLPPAGAEPQRPSRQTSRPHRFSPEPGITSDDGCSGRGKRRRMSTTSSGGGQPDAARQEAALHELGIHPGWLSMLQRAPTAGMNSVAALAQWQQHTEGDRSGVSPAERCAGSATGRKGGQHVTFAEASPTNSGASDGGHLPHLPLLTAATAVTSYGHMVDCADTGRIAACK